jgi:ribosomal protein S27AE
MKDREDPSAPPEETAAPKKKTAAQKTAAAKKKSDAKGIGPDSAKCPSCGSGNVQTRAGGATECGECHTALVEVPAKGTKDTDGYEPAHYEEAKPSSSYSTGRGQ